MRVRRELGLDKPIPLQYVIFLSNLAHGDFGRSIHFREPAFDVVRGYLAATLELGLTAFFLAALIAVPVGLFSAMRRNTLVDHVAMGLALIGQSAPTFFLGILFILLLSLRAISSPRPAAATGAISFCPRSLWARSPWPRSPGSPARPSWRSWGRTTSAPRARRGSPKSWVVAKHTLKNAAIPIVTITGLQFGTLMGGAVVTETVFAWPGIGRLAVQSIYNRDYAVVQCTVFLAALMFVVINFLVDLIYGVLDPRIRR